MKGANWSRGRSGRTRTATLALGRPWLFRLLLGLTWLILPAPGVPAFAQPAPNQPAKPAPGAAKPSDNKPAQGKPSDTKPAQGGSAEAEPAEPDAPPPPYEPQLLRLSEIMGALAFLRPLCGAPDGADWRARMASLIEAEANSTQRRDRLAGAFNKGYRGYALVYRTCTPSAEVIIARFLSEGGKLTRELTGRFGG
jgi:uncharacterized protein (TIGR02301 family)